MNQQIPNAATTLYAVIGDPISHSLSPVMHNAAFREIKSNAVYLAFQVQDTRAAVTGMRALGICGLSVTIPHKISIMEHLDHIDVMARDIGAVNTVVNRDGRLQGYNTDCLGAVNALLEQTAIENKSVLMLGAGGAARAIGYGILANHGKLTIANILEDEGRQLATELNVPFHPLSDFPELPYDILINATPVGMSPDVDAIPVAADSLRPERVVMDIIYNPLTTRLLREAAAIGCKTVDGVAMFVYQGAAQFEMWTGQKAPVDVMRKVVLDALLR